MIICFFDWRVHKVVIKYSDTCIKRTPYKAETLLSEHQL